SGVVIGACAGAATSPGSPAAASAAASASPAAACALPPANNPASALASCSAPPPPTLRNGSALPTASPDARPASTIRPGVHSARQESENWRQSATVRRSCASSAASAWCTFSIKASKPMSGSFAVCSLGSGWRDIDTQSLLDRLLFGGIADRLGGVLDRHARTGVRHQPGQLADA